MRTADAKYNFLVDLLADENMTSIKVATFKGTDKLTTLKETNMDSQAFHMLWIKLRNIA